MHKRLFDRPRLFTLLWLALFLCPLVTSAGFRNYTNEADLKVRTSPQSTGNIVFYFQYKGSETTLKIEVRVEEGWDRQQVATEIHRAFTRKFEGDLKVKRDGNRKVDIRKRNNVPRFALRYKEAHGVMIKVDYD